MSLDCRFHAKPARLNGLALVRLSQLSDVLSNSWSLAIPDDAANDVANCSALCIQAESPGNLAIVHARYSKRNDFGVTVFLGLESIDGVGNTRHGNIGFFCLDRQIKGIQCG